MSNQQISEMIKALAYGESFEQVAAAEGVPVESVREILNGRAAEVDAEREMLRKAGYLDG